MDLFFKVHRVFNLKYHADLKQMLDFFGRCVYGLPEEGVTFSSRAQELKMLLFSDVNSNHELGAEAMDRIERQMADLLAFD